MTTKTNVIPAHLSNDRYWRGTLYLFQNHSKLFQSTHPRGMRQRFLKNSCILLHYFVQKLAIFFNK